MPHTYSPVYLWAQIMIFTFFAAGLLTFWFRDPTSENQGQLREVIPDRAILWFAAAIASWAVASLLLLLVPEKAVGPIMVLVSLPSTLCLLQSIRGFRYAPSYLKAGSIDERDWRRLVVAVGAGDLVITLLLYFVSGGNRRIYFLPDTLLNLAVVTLLTLTFSISVRSRGFSGLFVVALVGGIALVMGQASYPIWPADAPDWVRALRLAGKIAFLITFLLVVITWAIEEGERAIDVSLLQMHFTGDIGTIRYPCVVTWSIRDHKTTCRLAKKAAEQLLRLAVNRIHLGQAARLNVETDLRTDRGGLEGITDQLKLGFTDLIEHVKDADFSGMYRLKVSPQNIHIDVQEISEAHPFLRDVLAPLARQES